MNIKYITSGLLAAMIVSSTAFLTSCADDLEVGKNIDESAYSGIYENNAYLRDGKSNLVSKVVELHSETYATTVKMGLSKAPNTATSAKVTFLVFSISRARDFPKLIALLFPELA